MNAQQVKVTRWVAIVAGLIGFVLSVLTPLLPVVQTTATLNWPQGGQLSSVTAPLITQTPVTMSITVPCDVIRTMPPTGGVVLGTAPADGKQAALNALFVNVTGSFVIGFYSTLSGPDGRLFAGARQRQFVITGFCGGYTTFSTFSLETFRLLEGGMARIAFLNIGVSIVTWLVAVWLGYLLASRLNRLKGS